MPGPSGADRGVGDGAAAVLDGMDDGVDVGVPFEPMDESSSEDDDDDDDDDIDDSITADESGSEVSDDDDDEAEGEDCDDSGEDDNDGDECSRDEMELASDVDEHGDTIRTTSPLEVRDDAADRTAEHAEQPPEHWEARLDESSGATTPVGSLVRQQRRDRDADGGDKDDDDY